MGGLLLVCDYLGLGVYFYSVSSDFQENIAIAGANCVTNADTSCDLVWWCLWPGAYGLHVSVHECAPVCDVLDETLLP